MRPTISGPHLPYQAPTNNIRPRHTYIDLNTALVTLVMMPYRIIEAFVERLRCTHTNPSSIHHAIYSVSVTFQVKVPV